MPTPLSELLARATAGELVVPDDWTQGRSAFGGLQAAFAVRVMRSLVPGVPLRTLQVTFVGPAAGTLRATASVLRTGASATHVEVRIESDGKVATIAIGVFGKARSSTVALRPAEPDERGAIGHVLQYAPGLQPAFLQHFTASWRRGDAPFTGSQEARQVIDIGMRDTGPATEAHAIAIADFIPPIGLTFLTAPANGSTLTWMLEFCVDDFADLGLRGWTVHAELLAARDGYTSQAVTVWWGGQLVAVSHQSMLVFG